ncbi:MerR family transcriptional regulator [Nocardia jinanensis]|uniref:MerR family transcriptional regulator n=1 Tax=Nocardia jinanensis TaxID=382504 RepID=A0A917R703_9NOCA|nr:MerR family transcriptional regulator [Nocardia jinanensis]GGK92379.1 MerR family transcriptional regulator [Nocardia jinanensis]
MPDGSASATDAAGYTVRAVADRLGIPTATLRSWNRRYEIGPTGHRPGTHRLYTETDITQLNRMIELIRGGATPAGAAAVVRSPTAAPGDPSSLLAAAFALDYRSVTAQLMANLRANGVVDTWERLCRPAFADIVARQLGGEGCIDIEHLLSWCITSALHRNNPPDRLRPRPIVLACTGGETHALPLEVLRAALAEREIGAQMLGADVPTGALTDTLARLERPADLVLWSQHESTALTSSVRAGTTAGARVFVGGPGWDVVILPAAVERLASLPEAVRQLG